jgi:hypothetical protein
MPALGESYEARSSSGKPLKQALKIRIFLARFTRILRAGTHLPPEYDEAL